MEDRFKPIPQAMPGSLLRLLSLSLLLAAVGLASAQGALADNAFYSGISEDGKVAVFSTKEQMVAGDTDQEADIYVRAFDDAFGEYVTREVSVGPLGGNDTRDALYDGMSAEGTKVFFSTKEPLVTEDSDEKEDIYLRDLSQNKTVLVSRGDGSCAAEGCGNGDAAAEFATGGVAANGGVVLFTTTEALNDLDEDGSSDIYARRIGAGETILVSVGDASCVAGECGNGGEGAAFKGVDKAGDKVVLQTPESLSSEDKDSALDIYERDLTAGTTKLVSVPGECAAVCVPSYGGISADGSHVFFETSEKLPGEDADSGQDVYGWTAVGGPVLASISPDGGNGGETARFGRTSPDGKAVYFLTTESLDSADADIAQDVYRNLEGTTTLISAGEGPRGNEPILASLDAISPERAIFSTSEPMVVGDADAEQDVYERVAGVTGLVSTGPEATGPSLNAGFAGASADASKVFFATSERLVAQDTDSSADIYRHSAGGTVLVSGSQIYTPKEFPASFRGASANGSKAFFVTQERLTEGDNDAEIDVYAWSEGGAILLISAGNGVSIGPPPPTLEKTAPASGSSSTTPAVVGQSDPGTAVKVYKSSNCTGQVVAQGSAGELAAGLTVTTPVVVGSTTNFSATAEADGIASKCSNWISYKQEDAPPPPPPGEEGGGETGGGGGGSAGGTGSTGGTTGSTGGSTGGTGGKTSGGGTRGGIAYAIPLPRVTFAPVAKTRLRRPTFRFLDATEQPGTHFFCRVDKRRWAQCTSPFKLQKLKLGRHVFSVKAVNAVGVPSASPVKRAFKVVR